MGYKLRATSYKLQVTSGLRGTATMSQVTSDELPHAVGIDRLVEMKRPNPQYPPTITLLEHSEGGFMPPTTPPTFMPPTTPPTFMGGAGGGPISLKNADPEGRRYIMLSHTLIDEEIM